MSPTQRLGLSAENWLFCHLQSAGYDVYQPTDFFKRYDLLVNGVLPLHVVTSSRHFTFYRGKARFRYVFNACRALFASELYPGPISIVVPPVVFFIPLRVMASHSGWLTVVSDLSLYSGWASEYRFNYSVLDTALADLPSLSLSLWNFVDV